ncbi:sensor histidine kinase [Streptomyces sp. NPDC057554]|uniref:sensor histidine kinase n=1 Tax=Streptomyces sp. NPDC057554 TaxID=3350538 RepID=UPI0036B38FB7
MPDRTRTAPAPPVGERGRQADLPAPLLARSITVTALVCYATVTILNVLRWGDASTLRLTICIGLVLLVFGVQFLVTAPSARSWGTRRRIGVLGLQVALTYLPLFWYGISWGSMEGPLAASVLLTLRPAAAWPLFGVVVASIPAYSLALGHPVTQAAYYLIAGMLCGIVIYGLSRLTDLVHEVHRTREELARMAVGRERLRFARDLHDLLGYSLSAIALKGELVHRLIEVRPEHARSETEELLMVARQALADVRVVSSGYRDMSLRDEATSAAAILAAADIQADVAIDCGRLHPVVDTVLATALREGVTNILRHSKVRRCSISATVDEETVLLSLVNDGAGRPGARSSDRTTRSSGLHNLRERFTEIGGGLTVGLRETGRFHLEAYAPIRPHMAEDRSYDELPADRRVAVGADPFEKR